VEPVVVKPETVSNQASANDSPRWPNMNGMAARKDRPNHARVVSRKVCRMLRTMFSWRFVSTRAMPAKMQSAADHRKA